MSFATETYTIQGMKQDTSEVLADKNFAFENFNIRLLVDNTTTNLVATQEKGNAPIKEIAITNKFFSTESEFTTPFTPANGQKDGGYLFNTLPFVVIGHCEIDKYLVLFGKVTTSTTQNDIEFVKGNDTILRLELIDNKFYGWLMYNDSELGFDINHPLETIGNVETNLVKKVYFIDGINVPRVVNVVSPNGGLLANINLGFALNFADEFLVVKNQSVVGDYPMGKVRFFYTYFNDNFSETNIVDWSPFFDCNYIHQGGGQDSQYKTQFAFDITVKNPETQFKFVRIYMQHFSQADPTKATIKYIERPIYQNTNVTFTFKFDEYDAKNATETYIDKRIINGAFVPYTFAEKGNRMFYGNIKQKSPSVQSIDLTKCTDVEFYNKPIGNEDLTLNRMYQYDPENTTFSGSNFDYMGFRKDNWYRFGLIAQHSTGEWSNVIFVCDKQCDISSATNITYSHDNRPQTSNYTIPSARIKITNHDVFVEQLQKLYANGYRKLKPVCVVPPKQYRTVITQGISSPTMYRGGDRNKKEIDGLFAIPSYFFRPQPLYPKQKYELIGNETVFRVDYPFTLRSINDLTIPQNIERGDQWLLNPKFDNEQYCNYNVPFREYRHGFALPPKDRINAELQSSDLAINDYFYKLKLTTGELVDSILYESYNFGRFINNTNIEQKETESFSWIRDIDWYIKYKKIPKAVPWHSVWTTGYDNTVFIDESFCTLNSPEIDYDFSASVEPFYKNKNISVVGYAQVTNSQTTISISDKQFKQEFADSDELSNDSAYEIDSGKCLFDLAQNNNSPYLLDAETIDYINALQIKKQIPNQPLSIINGPWWLDTMLVNAFVHDVKFKSAIRYKWMFGVFIDPWLFLSYLSDLNNNYDSQKRNLFKSSYKIDYGDNSQIEFGDLSNYFLHHEEYPDSNNSQSAFTFVRGLNAFLNKPSYKWTTAFYGETNKRGPDSNQWSVENTDSSVFYRLHKQKNLSSTWFIDYIPDRDVFEDDNTDIDFGTDNDYHLTKSLFNLAKLGVTLSTLRYASFGHKDDAFWENYNKYRTEYPTDRSKNVYARIESLPKCLPTNPDLNKIYSNWYVTNQSNGGILHNYGGDLRGTFSYYFFPYDLKNKPKSYYTLNSDLNANTAVITHPWLLPQQDIVDYRDNLNRLVAPDHYSQFGLPENDDKIKYFNGSKYGCHYYAPFSTNFIGAVFDPYYAHVVYPFMTDNTNTPFCGSHDVYRRNNDGNVRPERNSTHSSLYSNCTNYIKRTVESEYFENYTTYSDYYCSPNITQELRPEPDLSNIPFLKDTNVTKLYSYNYNNTTTEFVPLITHKTYTLTAAMKWYRGFKRLASNEYGWTTKLTSNGNYLTKSSIMGDLLFSGYLPQLFTKSGRVGEIDSSKSENGVDIVNVDVNYLMQFAATEGQPENEPTVFHTEVEKFLSNDDLQLLSLSFSSTPHIVYYKQFSNSSVLTLLDKFCISPYRKHSVVSNIITVFKPEFYYKEYVSTPTPAITVADYKPLHITNVRYWHKTTYPHTGSWQQYDFEPLHKAEDRMPYWNKDRQIFENYPKNPMYINHFIPEDSLIQYDNYGKPRLEENYWLLPISNVYNTDYLQNNPYIQDKVSVEAFDWKMCGDSVNISDYLQSLENSYERRSKSILFLEGDTYFQRYNCFKTISKDTVNATISDTSETSPTPYSGANDVTETASIMIESYSNLDGLYWEYNSTTSNRYSPLLNPFFNNQKQINPVYSIQNDLCDTFKQIDTNYDNSQLTHYPTKIMWSAQKIEGEVIDNWGIVPQTNSLLVSGEMGAINKFVAYNNNIFSLQDHGLSVLNYDAQVVQPTDTASTLSIYLSDGTKLQGVTYISRTIGTTNKWNVALGNNGFYWVDEMLQKIYCYGQQDESAGINDLTLSCGMQSWANDNLSVNDGIWNPAVFINNNKSIKANVDLKSGDIYWMNGNQCLCFNENIKLFTSFYSYERTPYKFNYLDKVYSVFNFENESKLYIDQITHTHRFYETLRESYIDLLINPNGLYDKVFNFIEYNAESYDSQNILVAGHNPYTDIEVSNVYQFGSETLNKFNTKEKFRLWRTTLPRDGKSKTNRIRSPWCRIKLKHDPVKLHVTKQLRDLFFDKLYYINVNYTIPEQPLKTNIQGDNK